MAIDINIPLKLKYRLLGPEFQVVKEGEYLLQDMCGEVDVIFYKGKAYRHIVGSEYKEVTCFEVVDK